jgi:sugar transferase (PEP-CTERM/EpsH1 system associated)
MNDVLFLVHRLPYPPDKGDKIRSYNLLKHLAARYEVHLGCFIDDTRDEKYIADVEAFCASSKIVPLNPVLATVGSATGLLTGEPMSWPYYRNKELMTWVGETLNSRPVGSIVCYSSPMSQYVKDSDFDGRRIMDFVDVDSDKWRQYARSKRWPMRWIYAREADRLLIFEQSVARDFDGSIFVTPNEKKLFDDLAPDSAGKHFSIANGVAADYFDPSIEFACPFKESAKPIVFTGMMNYWANVDAVTWFAEEIFPSLRNADESVEFWVVGASPTSEVASLESVDGITVTGRVPDVRPYLKHAALVVAPLRIARGIQNKVLEALAMGCPVVCTVQAASGLREVDNMPVAVVDEATGFAEAVLAELRAPADSSTGKRNRQYVLDHYDWNRNLENFEKIHKGGAP